MGAIFVRDRKLATSYETSVAMQWTQVVVGVVVTYMISSMVAPSTRFGFDGHVDKYFNYVMVNVAFITFQVTALQSFSKVVRDGQMQGTLEVVLSTPTALSLIVVSGCLWAFTWTSLQAAVELSVATMWFGLDLSHTNLVSGAVFLLLTVLSLSPLGIAAAAFTMIFKQVGPVDFLMNNLGFMFGGIYLPIASLPLWCQAIGWTLPITHALNGLRGATHGASLAQLAPDAIWLTAASIILFPASLYAFNRAVRHAKIVGTLASY